MTAQRSKTRVVVLATTVLLSALRVHGQSATSPANVAGVWRGTLVNFPVRAGAPVVDVTRIIGAWPVADSSCTPFRTTYSEGGVVRGEKAYQLCRGHGPDDLAVDEGDGIRLPARWLGDQLISPFKYDSTLLVSTMRIQGDTLIEEILTVPDRPAAKGVVTLNARSIQRLRLVRAKVK
jgi:hypothetical protein